MCFVQARNNLLAVEDMDGGTFTISNGGVFGSMFGTPIINPPQSAILGMHGIFDRPVAIGGKVGHTRSTCASLYVNTFNSSPSRSLIGHYLPQIYECMLSCQQSYIF